MSDAGRPRLHLAPRSGWLNDPLALTWRPDDQGGRYHLFFQHVPGSAVWAAHCVWGHATSPDLLHWDEHPVALRPASDETGAWSGCLVEDRILYTSVRAEDVERGRVRVAWPSDDGRWLPGDVLLGPPDDAAVTYFRDPFVVRDGESWRMLVGAGLADGTGCVLGYRSHDLTTWQYDGVVASRHTSETEPVWTGAIWECPQLLRLPQGDVLVISVADTTGPGDVVAAVGSYRDGRFDIDSWQQLTTGAPYAASAFRDRDDSQGLVTWVRGVAGDSWAGAVGTPLLLALDDGRVTLQAHPALHACRRAWHRGAPAWELEWDGTGELRLLTTRDDPVVRLCPLGEGLEVSTDDVSLTLQRPGHEPVRVLRDGPVLEVLVEGRLAALSISAGPLHPDGDGWRGWALT